MRTGGTEPTSASPAQIPRALLWLIGSAIAAAVVLASSRGDIDKMTYGDGSVYLYVAAHLTTPPAEIHPVVVERGTSARYGRIGLPIATWILAGGNPSLMRIAHPLILVIAAGAAAVAMASLLPRAPLPAAFLAFAVPGYSLSLAGGYAEALALPLALWAIVYALRERWWLASGYLAIAMLTRENAGAVLIALLAFAALRRRFKALPVLAASLLPLGFWYLAVQSRFGHIPFLDPYFRESTYTFGTPFIALFDSFAQAPTPGSAVAAGLHVVLAVAAIMAGRLSLAGLITGFAALQLLTAGPFAWLRVGDAARVFTFLEMAGVLALLVRSRPEWADDGLAEPYARSSPSPAGT